MEADRGSHVHPTENVALDVTGVKVSAEDVDLVAMSRRDMLVEGPIRLNPGTETGVEICRAGAATRLRGRVLRCAVKSLSARGPRYELAIAFNEPLAPRAPAPCGFDIPGMEFGEPDPAFAANAW